MRLRKPILLDGQAPTEHTRGEMEEIVDTMDRLTFSFKTYLGMMNIRGDGSRYPGSRPQRRRKHSFANACKVIVVSIARVHAGYFCR